MPDSKDNEDEDFCEPDHETAGQLSECVLGHYVKHHHVVLGKLRLTQRATKQTLEKISTGGEEVHNKDDNMTIDSLEQCQKIWDENIQLFTDAGISEDGLSKIDKVLTAIPTTIKKSYDSLLEDEPDLLKAMDDLQQSAAEYKVAYDRVQTIQTRPDKMSGMDPSQYDVGPEQIEGNAGDEQGKTEKSYKITIPPKK